MNIQRKHIITGGLALLTITGAYLYWQYTKIMEYCLSFDRLKFNATTLDKVNLDIFLNFKNPSSLKIDIHSQEYTVYVNGAPLTTITNATSQTIMPESTSIISVNIDFNPKKVINILKGNAADILLNSSKVNVKIDMKLKVGLFFFKVNIPYVYETNLKELLSGVISPKAQDPNAPKC